MVKSTKKSTKKKAPEGPPAKKHAVDLNIKTVTQVPAGYVPAKTFASKCGISQAGLTQARQAGKFASNSIRYIKREKQRAQLYYHWDSLGPEFIRTRPHSRWPEWFKEEEAKLGKVLSGEHEAAAGANPTGSGIETKMASAAVYDLNSAKFRTEQIKIEKQELELQAAKNQVLDIEEIVSLFTEVGMDIKQSLLAIAPRVAPLVAAETSPHKCLKILEDEISLGLKGVESLAEYLEEKKGL